MEKAQVSELIKAGVHFGHLTRKWNPNMSPYIYMERNGIHIINLYKTVAKLEDASNALKKIASSGRKILFVATKKQAKDIVSESSKKINMPYITERWPGGMLTNFVTIRKAVKKMSSIDRMKQDGTFNSLSKKEKLQIGRLREKLEKNLGSISNMTRLPGAIFIVDILREKIAVKEAQKLKEEKKRAAQVQREKVQEDARKQQIKAEEEAQTYEAEKANTIGSLIMRLFSFRGRIGRDQFILGDLIKWIFLIITTIVSKETEISSAILFLSLILIGWLNFSLLCRRLKDCGTTPYILILLLIPFLNILVGLVVTLVCIFQPTSRKCPQKYGEKYDIF